MNKAVRILRLPIGLIKGLIELANNSARDIENRKRFQNATIDSGCRLSESTILNKHVHVLSGCVINNSQIGAYSYINRNSLVQNAVIGNYCSIAHDVMIGLGNHPLTLFSTSPLFFKRNNTFNLPIVNDDENFTEYRTITIGCDVWVGAGVIILDGITIGHGAVIAAGSVVTKDVPAYSIVAGVPAKIVKTRFCEEDKIRLLESKWWLKDAKDAYLYCDEHFRGSKRK